VAKALLEVLHHRSPERRPVWLMRQAGRYLPEYRAVRQQAGSFLDLCYSPKLATEVTLQPLRRYDLDASIVFADILLVPHAMGCDLKFVENEGPELTVVRDGDAVQRLATVTDAWQFDRVYETLALVKQQVAGHQVLIGFCGAPWTVASYMIEGRGSDRQLALAAARGAPAWFMELVNRVVEVSIAYLIGQVRAGAEVLQIFDSWAGDLPVDLHDRWVHQPIATIVKGVRAVFPDVPVIAFGRGLGSGHGALARATGVNAISIEQGVDLSGIISGVPQQVAIQGNLDPELLKTGGTAMHEAVVKLCDIVPIGRHIFNLGHGILQQTPPEHVAEMLGLIRGHDKNV
jgi:uroporphyrinogen decarboxylase